MNGKLAAACGILMAVCMWSMAMADDNDGGAIRAEPRPAAPRAEPRGRQEQAAADTPANSEAAGKLAEAERLYAEEDKPRDAIRVAEPLVRDFERAKDWDNLVDALFLIGNAYYDLGDWKKAQDAMQRAQELGSRHFPDQMGTGALKVIGECQYEQKDYDAALETYEARVTALRKEGTAADQGELAGALYDNAALLIDLGRMSDALPLLDAAVKANGAHGASLAQGNATQEDKDANVIDHAEIVYLQAVAHYKQDQLDKTVPLLEQALALFASVQESGREDVSDRMVSALDDLVQISEKQGDTGAAGKYRQQRDELNR